MLFTYYIFYESQVKAIVAAINVCSFIGHCHLNMYRIQIQMNILLHCNVNYMLIINTEYVCVFFFSMCLCVSQGHCVCVCVCLHGFSSVECTYLCLRMGHSQISIYMQIVHPVTNSNVCLLEVDEMCSMQSSSAHQE